MSLIYHLSLSLSSFSGVCGCCGALRPRYKRLVDNIFPEDPEVRSSEVTLSVANAFPNQNRNAYSLELITLLLLPI